MSLSEIKPFRLIFAGITCVATLLVGMTAQADPCEPARLDPAMSEPPLSWRAALDELVTASGEASQS